MYLHMYLHIGNIRYIIHSIIEDMINFNNLEISKETFNKRGKKITSMYVLVHLYVPFIYTHYMVTVPTSIFSVPCMCVCVCVSMFVWVLTNFMLTSCVPVQKPRTSQSRQTQIDKFSYELMNKC